MRFTCAVVLSIAIGLWVPAQAVAQTVGFVYGLARSTYSPAPHSLYGLAVRANGTLTPLAGFPLPTGGSSSGIGPEAIVYDAAGSRLYALNDASNTVSAWSVNQTTGALTSLPFSPIGLPAAFAGGCISVDPSGSVLAVAGTSATVGPSVTAYRVDAGTATLASGSPFRTGTGLTSSCTFSRDGAFFYTGGSGGVCCSVLAGFSVEQSTGILTPLAGSPFNVGLIPEAVQTDSAGRLFTSGFTGGAVESLAAFTTSAGIPTAVSGNPFPSGQSSLSTFHGLVHPAGYYLATSSQDTIGVFRVSGAGSATTLTAVAGSPFASGGFSMGGTSTSVLAGPFIVTSHYDSRNVTLFGFNSTTGALTPLQTTPFGSQGPSGGNYGLAFAPAISWSPGDFDADRKTDLTVFRPSTGTWYHLLSGNNYTTYQAHPWGLSTDIPVPGDYDGDGNGDLGIFRRSTGTWYILQSSTNYATFTAKSWGAGTDIPVPGDYDGDGKTDLAVYRPSSGIWYILQSGSDYTTYLAQPWGLGTDIPVPGDYDGDGKTDPGVYRPSAGVWYILQSGSNYTTYLAQSWGTSTDTPVQRDYDGDGRADLGVYSPLTGNWSLLLSTTNYTRSVSYQWGLSTDTPLPGDYDGDGKTDPAVFRPSTGIWYVLLSSTNYTTYLARPWGLGTDIPVLRQ